MSTCNVAFSRSHFQSQYLHQLAFPQSTNRAVNPHFMLRNLRHKKRHCSIANALMYHLVELLTYGTLVFTPLLKNAHQKFSRLQ